MSSEPVGIGVVGVGAIALRGILPHLTQEDVRHRVRVVALCDTVRERAEAAAESFGVAAAYGSVDELLSNDHVDAVTVASPIGLHYEHCRLALESGKHVHVNKTMTTTVAEADELIELAKEQDLRLVPSPGEILRPQLTRTRELIESGAIGELVWAICGGTGGRYHEQSEHERVDAPGGTTIDPAWYFRKPGGGPMYDITVYALHQLTSVLGPARRVTAFSGIRTCGPAVSRDGDSRRGRRQHDSPSRLWRRLIRHRPWHRSGSAFAAVRCRNLLRNVRHDRRCSSQR
jgi:predicted dehydrogenase